jgi:2-iminoacetate synthase
MLEELFSKIESVTQWPVLREAEAIAEIGTRAMEEEAISLEDAWQLLNINVLQQPELASLVLAAARKKKAQRFNETVFSISPLYVTSICREHCTYCNFRAENKGTAITRLRLTPDQLREEVDFLVNHHGLRVVELVYSSDPKFSIDTIAEHIRITADVLEKAGGGIVGINAAPFAVDEYQRLKAAGLNFIVLWQETYNRERYRELHIGRTPKTDYERRVTTFDRVIQGGIKNIGLGVLSGLAPWRADWLSLMAHEQYLYETYGVYTAVLGVPRLKPAKGALVQTTSYIPTDEEYLLAIAVHNLFSPITVPFVNTRERWALCVEAARGGGAIFTFNCSTIPGGYTQGTKGYQFPTDDFPASEYVPKLYSEGLSPVMKWTFEGIRAGVW